jgi:hypothetical protein
MVFVPSNNAVFPLGPMATKVAVPATAKTVLTDTSNAAILVASMANNRQQFGLIYAQPAITYVAGKLMLFLYDGATAFDIDEIAHAAGTVSTTASPGMIQFTRWSASQPLIIPEGHTLYVASAVAQSAGAFVAHAQLGKVF